jgi:hypothetical protein
VAKKIYALYSRKEADWEKEFSFHASGIDEARFFAYAWADRGGIGKNRVGVKEDNNSACCPIFVAHIRSKRHPKIISERISA